LCQQNNADNLSSGSDENKSVVDDRGTIFVEAMIVFAVIGVLAFLIGLLALAPQRQQAATKGAGQPTPSPRWYEFALALILLAAIAAFAIWIISNSRQWVWGETIGNWRSDPRAIAFAAIMVALGVIGLAVSLAYALVQSSQRSTPRRPNEIVVEAPPPSAAPAATPSPLRVLGLLILALSLVLLCWIGLSSAEQFGLIGQLIYPAALGVGLVLLFDKATRAWGTKGGAETVREWLFCDLLIFLLVLAFLHLRSLAKPETYAGSFWDLLNVVLFFAAFWTVDRAAARGRFLVGYGYLVILPLLLLISDTVQGVPAAASWWTSIWPFFILAAVFFVFEVITLISSSGERHILPAVKDAVFVVLYAVLLIVAMGARGHA
jgi:hypothetical protein